MVRWKKVIFSMFVVRLYFMKWPETTDDAKLVTNLNASFLSNVVLLKWFSWKFWAACNLQVCVEYEKITWFVWRQCHGPRFEYENISEYIWVWVPVRNLLFLKFWNFGFLISFLILLDCDFHFWWFYYRVFDSFIYFIWVISFMTLFLLNFITRSKLPVAASVPSVFPCLFLRRSLLSVPVPLSTSCLCD